MSVPASLGLIAILALTACGRDAYVVLAIESARAVPAEVALLDVRTTTTDEARELSRERIDIAAHAGFPLEILYEPEDDTPKSLRVQAQAYAGDALVTSVTADYAWRDDATTVVHLSLEP